MNIPRVGSCECRGAAEGLFFCSGILGYWSWVGQVSIPCHLKNYEDGFPWDYSRFYGPTVKEVDSFFWVRVMAIGGF